jgi:hypothetical protein
MSVNQTSRSNERTYVATTSSACNTALQRHLPFTMDHIESSGHMTEQVHTPSTVLSKVYQWLKKLLPCLFGKTKTSLTAQELQDRIQKGRAFIHTSIDQHLRHIARNLPRDKFLIRMSYNGEAVVCNPATHPINIDQLKRDAMIKFEAMMHRPSVVRKQQNDNLVIETSSFSRAVHPSNGTLSPFVVHGYDCRFRCFGDSDGGDCCDSGAVRFYEPQLRTWLNNYIPASDPDRQNAIAYALESLNWL